MSEKAKISDRTRGLLRDIAATVHEVVTNRVDQLDEAIDLDERTEEALNSLRDADARLRGYR